MPVVVPLMHYHGWVLPMLPGIGLAFTRARTRLSRRHRGE